MPEVYRVEFTNGEGVYIAAYHKGYSDVLHVHQHDEIDHPRPSEDGMGMSSWADMIFGFADLTQMRAWFNGSERLYLATEGLMLSKYYARGPIISGKRQCAFYRQSATLIWQKPLNYF